MKYKSKKQFFWHLNRLKKDVVHTIKPKLQPQRDEIVEANRIEDAVHRRVRWELGLLGYNVWRSRGYKDIGTLARAYGIK